MPRLEPKTAALPAPLPEGSGTQTASISSSGPASTSYQEVPAGARADLTRFRQATRTNAYRRDPGLAWALASHRPDEFATREPELEAFGEVVAGEIEALSFTANEDPNLPRLERWDGLGHRVEEIAYHPAYHRLGELVYEARIMADYETPGQELFQLAKFYLAAFQGEAPHLCPMSCTAGLIKAIQEVGSDELKTTYLPGLLDPDYRTNLVGAQFVTEVQGGSDVGAGAVTAVPQADGSYRIHGEKWFCSVAQADLYLMTARVEGQGEGTAGLGCFVVPRKLSDGSANAFHLRRLKKKLGTRSMASAEIDWNGSTAYALGPPERGFKTVVEIVLQTSRVFNAFGTTGSMMRATLDAFAYAQNRQAFGAPIAHFPEIQQSLARMQALSWACLFSTVEVTVLADRVANKDPCPDLRGQLRMLTNINKYWTSLLNTRTIRDAMEVLGGNGTIEDFSVLPRLYRDAMVLESWEGAHNVLAAQVARDILRYRLHEPCEKLFSSWLEDLEASLPSPELERLRVRLEDLSLRFQGLFEASRREVGEVQRPLVDAFATTFQLFALARVAPTEGASVGTQRCLAAFRALDQLFPIQAPRVAAADVTELLGSHA